MTGGMEMFIISGIFLVAGAVWVVMYNSDLLLKGIMSVFGRITVLAPILKTAISYPMASRFRTGMALALFSLIVFTLAVISVMNASFDVLLKDTDRFGGGFHITSQVRHTNPIADIRTDLDSPDGVGLNNFQIIASQNVTPIKIRQADKGNEFEDLYLTGVDTLYMDNNSYRFDMLLEGYTSEAQAWQALKDTPSLANDVGRTGSPDW